MSRTMSWLVWGNFWFTIIFNTVLMFLYAFQCLPAKANIDLSLRFHPDTRCLNYLPLYYSGSILHVISDILLIAAPIKLVLGLQMSFKKKITVCIMLGIGGLAVLCSVVRMGYILNYTKGTDMTWDAVEVSAWGHLEVTLAVASACLPALRPLFTKFFPNLMSSRTGHSRTRSHAWTGDKLGGTAKFTSSKSGAVRTDLSWKSGWSMNDRRHHHDWEIGRGSQTQLVDEIELEKADRVESTGQTNPGGIMKTMSVDVRYEEPTTPDKVYVHEEEVAEERRRSPPR